MHVKRIRAFIAALIIIFVSGGVLLAWEPTSPEVQQKATWLWDTTKIVSDRERLLQFLTEQQVTTLYLQINPEVPVEDYQTWMKELRVRGIETHALGGDPKWASPDPADRLGAQEFAQWIVRYQSLAGEQEAFTGIHLDVEPYLHQEWNSRKKEIIDAFQTVLHEIGTEAKKQNLLFGVDIPFWLHEIGYVNKFGHGNLAEWVMNQTDMVTIMAYRNHADRSGGILEIVEPLFQLAETAKSPLVIAVETTDQPEEYVSFSGMSPERMKEELQQVHNRYGENPSFAGIAIHDAWNWMALEGYSY